MKEFDFVLDHNIADCQRLYTIINELKPEWPQQGIRIEKLAGGTINTIWLCSIPTDDHKLIVRIHPKDVAPHVNRDLEYRILKRLTEANLIQPLYARFRNGFVYRYGEGVIDLYFPRMMDRNVQRMILSKIVPVHRIPLAEFGADCLTIKDNGWYRYFQVSIHEIECFPSATLQERFTSVYESKENVCKEAEFCMRLLDDLWGRYPHVLGHFDLWRTNLVHDEQKSEVHLIDWEFAGPGIAVFELANITEDFRNETTKEFEESVKRSWVQSYLHRMQDTIGEITAEVEERWFQDLKKASSVAQMCLCVWALWSANRVYTEDENEQAIWLERSIRHYEKFKYWKNKNQELN